MTESLTDRIMSRISEAEDQYYRLVLVVAPAAGGKTSALQSIHRRMGVPLINVNLELSQAMLELTGRERILNLPKLLSNIVGETNGDVVLLDNTEILFDVNLKQDPLRVLQRLSRNRTVVATWNGEAIDKSILYAEPGHPEYRRYPLEDFFIARVAGGIDA